MLYINTLIKSFDNFTRLSNARARLRNLCDDSVHLKSYLRSINFLPLTWEDTVEGPDYIFNQHHHFLANGSARVKFDKVVISDLAVSGQCHRQSLLIKEKNPHFKLFLGFAVMETCCGGNDWIIHSWCTDGDTIIEGTPLTRTIYYGREVEFTKQGLADAYGKDCLATFNII